jgi:glycosyltransferase involved in cell wall biosynthesis
MSKLVSILMPTRNRVDWMGQAVESIRKTATNNADVEILLRADDDQPERLPVLERLKSDGVIDYIIGPRRSGYDSVSTFLDELMNIATGRFFWNMDDDAWIEGDWQTPLSHAPSNVALQPEYYHLGPSEYKNLPVSPVGLIVPREFALALRPTPYPADQVWMDVILRRKMEKRLMLGVHYYHEGRPRG